MNPRMTRDQLLRRGAAGVTFLSLPSLLAACGGGGDSESSGELEDMLERAAVSQERELDGILAALVGLLGPLLIVLMGLFVMAIVFAMLMPIFEMNTLIR